MEREFCLCGLFLLLSKIESRQNQRRLFRKIASSKESVIPLFLKKMQSIKMCCDVYQNPQTFLELIKELDPRCIQNLVKHVRRSVLRKQSTAKKKSLTGNFISCTVRHQQQHFPLKYLPNYQFNVPNEAHMYLTFIPNYHRQKCSEFTLFPRVVILWKGTGSAKFPHQEIR